MKRINIFGSSEKLEELGSIKIDRLLSLKSDSIGINHFPMKYSNVNYWLLSDQSMVEKIKAADGYKGQKIISSVWASWKINKTWGWDVHELFERNKIENDINNSGWIALWWAIKEGYTHANLYGILDGEYKNKINNNSRFMGKIEDIHYKNVFEGEHKIETKHFNRFLNDVETGFNGRIKICRPLLESSEALIR